MNSEQKISRGNLILLILQVAIAIGSLVVMVYFYNENLQLSYSSRRADLSLLVEKNWQYSTENVTFSVSGELCNEGSRKTIVNSVEIGISYIGTKGSPKETYSLEIEKPAFQLGWQNLSFLEGESKEFYLSLEAPLVWMSAVEDYRKPDEGWVKITHYDGSGIQIEELTFSRLSEEF